MTKNLIDWRSTEFLPMDSAARVLGVSRAQLYRLAHLGELSLTSFLGRTVVPTREVQRLAQFAAKPWAPSDRNAAAVAALRAKRG